MSRHSQGGQHDPNTQDTASARVTRLAPSPTGALHLGNARTFLINWAIARQRGWRVVLRIEDLDGPRVKEGAGDAAIETMRWLGLDWDDGALVQSDDLSAYVDAMKTLAGGARAYPCALTRTEIAEAASAPHGRSGSVEARGLSPVPLPHAGGEPVPRMTSTESRYPVELRPALEARPFDDTETNWRFVVDEEAITFQDGFCGPQRFAPIEIVGDFVIWTKGGRPAYQLAVVVDDHRQGVTDVVRGDDLLDSAARQLMLYRALGLAPEPAYIHLPLVVGADGRRLAKRHGDTRLDSYRERGVDRDRVIGLLAAWSGVVEKPEPMSPEAFVRAFNLRDLPRPAVVFTPEDDRWLLA